MNRKFYALQALLGEEILLMLHLRRNVVNTLMGRGDFAYVTFTQECG